MQGMGKRVLPSGPDTVIAVMNSSCCRSMHKLSPVSHGLGQLISLHSSLGYCWLLTNIVGKGKYCLHLWRWGAHWAPVVSSTSMAMQIAMFMLSGSHVKQKEINL